MVLGQEYVRFIKMSSFHGVLIREVPLYMVFNGDRP